MSQSRTPTYLSDYRPSAFLIPSIQMRVDIFDEVTVVSTTLQIKKNVAIEGQVPLRLDGQSLRLKSVKLNEVDLSESDYLVTEDHLIIHEVPDAFELQTQVEIDPKNNTLLMGLYCSNGNYCTQCESEGFRRITYSLDRPDVLSIYTVTLTGDQQALPYLLCNGNIVDKQQDLPDGRHQVTWHDPFPKPCYLFALVAGDFDVIDDTFVTRSGRTIDLLFYIEKGFKNQGYFAMNALKISMEWDETAFGREYDLDIYMIVAVNDFLFGAMENKGLNIFNTKYVLAEPETATDMDYLGIENVIGHEYFHNWSGNRVTCRDWFQLTLKEGLTVFRDQCFSTEQTSASFQRINNVDAMKRVQFKEDQGPLSHPIKPLSYIEINNFYTATIYNKGAEVIRMLQTLLTPPVFREALDQYFSVYDGQAVTTEDFLKIMETQAQRDLTAFKRWYDQSGTPRVTVSGEYDKKLKNYTLHISQHCEDTPGQSDKQPFHFPLTLALLDQEGKAMVLNDQSSTEVVIEVENKNEDVVFENIPCQPVPSLLRNFSAPVELDYPYTANERYFLMQHDTDPITRWEASQRVLADVVMEQVMSPSETILPSALLATYRHLLSDVGNDLFLVTNMLTLPTTSDLLLIYPGKDCVEIELARYQVQRALACQLHALFEEQYHLNDTGHEPYSVNLVDIEKRSFKNCCLQYLLATQEEAYIDLAQRQWMQSNNMTDTMGALVALNQYPSAQREKVLIDFYDRWAKTPLVVNKWLSLHASLPASSTFETVKKLSEGEAFSINNPNAVRALMSVFQMNVIGFHGGDYQNHYAWFFDQVIMLNDINPLVASSLVKPAATWRLFDSERGEALQAQLQRLLNTPGIAPGIYEVAKKSVE